MSPLLGIGLSELLSYQSQAQVVWKSVDASQVQPFPMIWENISPTTQSDQSQLNWEVIPTTEGEKEPSSNVIWDELEADDETFIPESKTESKSVVDPPSNLEEAKALENYTPPIERFRTGTEYFTSRSNCISAGQDECVNSQHSSPLYKWY